jgi:hypothetical protein
MLVPVIKTLLGQVSIRSRSTLTVGQKDAYSVKAAIDCYQLGFSASFAFCLLSSGTELVLIVKDLFLIL